MTVLPRMTGEAFCKYLANTDTLWRKRVLQALKETITAYGIASNER